MREDFEHRLHAWTGKFSSKLVNEDQELKQIQMQSGGTLYAQLYKETIHGDTSTGEEFDDPVRFLVFYEPRFKQNRTHINKIVLNPNKTSRARLIEFLHTNFKSDGLDPRGFYRTFRLGRVDFNIDVDDFSVEELHRMIYVATKVRRHDSLFTPQADPEGFLRIIGETSPQTLYVGKGEIMLRVYDKVREAKYQIAVAKREGRHIPESLRALAAMRCRTRIEMQIRSLSRSGTTTKDGKVIDKKQRRGFHSLRTLWDLFNMRKDQCDIFDDVLFADLPTPRLFDTDWQNTAFAALVQFRGMDAAVKALPIRKRQEIKAALHSKPWKHNLNEQLYREITQWNR